MGVESLRSGASWWELTVVEDALRWSDVKN